MRNELKSTYIQWLATDLFNFKLSCVMKCMKNRLQFESASLSILTFSKHTANSSLAEWQCHPCRRYHLVFLKFISKGSICCSALYATACKLTKNGMNTIIFNVQLQFPFHILIPDFICSLRPPFIPQEMHIFFISNSLDTSILQNVLHSDFHHLELIYITSNASKQIVIKQLDSFLIDSNNITLAQFHSLLLFLI